MSKLVILPDPLLRTVSTRISEITDAIRTLASDMLETMYASRGCGLAAIQVGVPQRLVVMDVAEHPMSRFPIVMINPEIIQATEETREHLEGCLSIPGVRETIARPDRITVRYTTLEGETVEQEGGQLFATCVQHEIDHLNGVLFIDHLSRLKRERIIKKLTKAAKHVG
jgi:peptide deformylase